MPPMSYYGELIGEAATGEGALRNVGFRCDFAHQLLWGRQPGHDYSKSPFVMRRPPVTFSFESLCGDMVDERGYHLRASGYEYIWQEYIGSDRYRISHSYDPRHGMGYIRVYDYRNQWVAATYRGKLSRKEYIWKILQISYWYEVDADLEGCFPPPKPICTSYITRLREEGDKEKEIEQKTRRTKNAAPPRGKP